MYKQFKEIVPNDIELYLAKPDKTIIGKLTHRKKPILSEKSREINELSLILPYMIEVDHKQIKNPHIDNIKDKFLIKAIFNNKIEWFVIDKISKVSDESEDLELQCFSLPYQLNYSTIIGFEETGLNCKMVNDKILKGTGWKTGYINPKFNLKYRRFEFSSQSRLSAIYDIRDTFEAVIVFDTEDRLIHYYEEGELSQYKGFTIERGKYIQNIKQEIEASKIVTRLYVYGHDDLRINTVNPTGQSYIDDFSYYLYPFQMDEEGNVIKHSEHMSDELAKNLVLYNQNVTERKDEFNQLLKRKTELQKEKTQKENDLFNLNTELEIILDAITVNKNIGEPTGLLIKERNAKNKEISSKNTEIKNLKIEIDNIDKQIQELNSDLKLESHLTPTQLEELQNFIHSDEWTDDSIFDPNDLYEAGFNHLKEVNSPPINITTSIVNFFAIVSEHYNWDRFKIGTIIRATHDILGIDVKATLSEIQYDFDDRTIDVVISNTKETNTIKDKIERTFYTVGKVDTDFNKRKIPYDRVAYNFNIRNDRIKEAPVSPILTDGALFYKDNDDGSVNLILKWDYPEYTKTEKNEHNIDGFLIYLYYDKSDETYQFGSKMADETRIDVPFYSKSYTFPSVPANLYYTVGIQAYRRVDEDIDSSGILLSEIVRFNDYDTVTTPKVRNLSSLAFSSPMFTSSDDGDVSKPFQPKQEVNIKGRVNGAKWNVGLDKPTSPKVDDIWINPKTRKVLIWDGIEWSGDIELDEIKEKLQDNQQLMNEFEQQLSEELEKAHQEVEEAMKAVELEVNRIENEVVPEVEKAIKETEIPTQPEPPEEIPTSRMWNDTSYTPPRIMHWDEELAEWLPLAPTEDEIKDMMDEMRASVERESRAYSKLEILKTKKYLSDRIDNVVEEALADIQELLEIKDELIETANNIDAILDEYDGKFYNFEQVIDRINGQISTTIENIERIDGVVEGHSSQIEQNRQAILAKVDSIIYERDKTGILTDIERTQADLTLLSDKIDLRVTKEEYNAGVGILTDKIIKAETSITQLSDSILLKADKSELKNYVDVQEYTNKMALLDIDISKITQRVENTELSIDNLDGSVTDVVNQVSDIEQTATKISQSVSELRGDFDGLQIGGVNLLRNSSFSNGTQHWSTGGANNAIKVVSDGLQINYNTTGWVVPRQGVSVYLSKGETLTLQVEIKTDDHSLVQGVRGRFVGLLYMDMDVDKTVDLGNGWKRYYFQYEATKNYDIQNVVFGLSGFQVGAYIINHIQLEKGNKATDWSPALEDTDSRLSLAETSITQLSDRISLKASQTSVDSLTQRMTQAESEIKLMPDKISLAVRDGIDDLEVSGRNLLGNSKKPRLRTNNATTSPLRITEFDDFFRYEPIDGSGLSTYSQLNDSNHPIYDKNWLGKDMVVSMMVRVSKDVRLRMRFSDWGRKPSTTIKQEYFNIKASDGWTRLVMQIPGELINRNPDTEYVRFLLYTVDNSNNIVGYTGHIDSKEWFIGFGTKDSGWSLAPEDQVNKTNVLSSINLSPEGVKIQGTKIDIKGLVSILNADDDPGTLINGSKIYTGSILAHHLAVNEIFSNSAVIAKIQSDSVKTATLSATKITGGTLDAARVTVKNLSASSIVSGTLDATKVNVTNLNANSIKTGVLRGLEVQGVRGTFGDVTVTDGDFNLQDEVTGNKYSATPRRNLLKDHSFEMVREGDSFSTSYNWCEMLDTHPYFDSPWYKVGSPKVAMPIAPSSQDGLPTFGRKAIVVRNAHYVRQYVDGVASSTKYTVSAFFKRQWKVASGGIPRIEIWHTNALGDRVAKLVNATFSSVKSDYSVSRHSTTFVTPSSFGIFDSLEVIISGGNDRWIQCDGVQMVEGDRASVYQPEDSVWEIHKGQISPINRMDVLWQGEVYPTGSQTVRPEKNIYECRNGWLLQWQRYVKGSGTENHNYNYSVIPKAHAQFQSGAGIRLVLARGYNTIYKYIYVHYDKIVGADSNRDDNRHELALTAVYEW